MKRDIPSILVLEPNALQCDLIKVTLKRNQMNPIICNQPDKLRQYLIDYIPDILLIDTYLPNQNGLDLIDQLNSETLLHRTKFFFISAMGYPEVVQKAARLGASGFLVKPLNPELMINKILNCFKNSIEICN